MSLFKRERLQNLNRGNAASKPTHTVLIVDDEVNNVEVLRNVLDERYIVLTATNGFEALDIIQRHPDPESIGIIISDHRMPGMTGVELLEKTQTLIPYSIRIILTGHTDVADIISAINVGGIFQYLIKPFERLELLSTVQRGCEQYDRERQVRHLALHDSLTGLPNRSLFQDRLKQSIALGRRNHFPVAVVLMDLDRFKHINDTLGHQAGDKLLQQVAERLRNSLRDSDTVARLGGDEFALVAPGLGRRDMDIVINRITSIFNNPFSIEGMQIEVRPSMGIALFPEHGDEPASLLQRADIAMYQSKSEQSAYAIYDARQDKSSATKIHLMSELRSAIQKNELILYYQPLVDFKTGATLRVEALIRWSHPKLGMMEPDQFIPLAEQTGNIGAVTQWVIENAIMHCVEWRAAGIPISVAVNLSASDLMNQALPDSISAALNKYNLDPSTLVLELSETSVMKDPIKAPQALTKLRSIGVRISIDDFGTGYSSLAQLKKLPVNEIKIDRSFVTDMQERSDESIIVRSTIELGHNMGLEVTAEGVEGQSTLDLLKQLGCDSAQGYLVSRPMPASELADWMANSPFGAAKPKPDGT
jgi:diguanylate cyclase (GGDEF)-like protein